MRVGILVALVIALLSAIAPHPRAVADEPLPNSALPLAELPRSPDRGAVRARMNMPMAPFVRSPFITIGRPTVHFADGSAEPLVTDDWSLRRESLLRSDAVRLDVPILLLENDPDALRDILARIGNEEDGSKGLLASVDGLYSVDEGSGRLRLIPGEPEDRMLRREAVVSAPIDLASREKQLMVSMVLDEHARRALPAEGPITLEIWYAVRLEMRRAPPYDGINALKSHLLCDPRYDDAAARAALRAVAEGHVERWCLFHRIDPGWGVRTLLEPSWSDAIERIDPDEIRKQEHSEWLIDDKSFMVVANDQVLPLARAPAARRKKALLPLIASLGEHGLAGSEVLVLADVQGLKDPRRSDGSFEGRWTMLDKAERRAYIEEVDRCLLDVARTLQGDAPITALDREALDNAVRARLQEADDVYHLIIDSHTLR